MQAEFQQVLVTAQVYQTTDGWFCSVDQNGIRVLSGPYSTRDACLVVLGKCMSRGAELYNEPEHAEPTDGPRD